MIGLIRRFKPQPKAENWEDYFHGNETLIWEGYPARGIKGTFGMVFLSIFGLPFLLGGVGSFIAGIVFLFAKGGWPSLGEGLLLMVSSLPFLFVGLGLVFGTWIATYYSSEFVRYALTNKRAYIAKSWWNHSIESYPIKSDNKIELKEGRFDTVYFFNERTVNSDGDAHDKQIGFEWVEDGMNVYKLLRDVQAHAAIREQERPENS